MTAPGQPGDGFARTAGGAASRGAVLIGIAVLIGLALLAWGFDGADNGVASTDIGDSDTDSGDDGGDDAADDSGDDAGDDGSDDAGDDAGDDAADDAGADDAADDTSPTTPPPTDGEARPPGEVKVLVVNGTGGSGVAGRGRDKVTAAGYVGSAKNSSSDQITDSSIYYKADYAKDAEAVAVVLGAPLSTIRPAPENLADLLETAEGKAEAEEFHVIVIQGSDGLTGT